MVSVNISILNEVASINIKRILYFSMIGMIINLTTVLILSMDLSSGNEIQTKWRMGIMICHSILFFIMATLGFTSFFLRKKERIGLLMRLLQILTIVTILIFGAILSSIDQLVTTNITPFLIACNITGVVFLIRPITAITVYLSVFAVFYFVMGLVQMNLEILLSNRINGFAATGIGICLSTILWKTNVSKILQNRFIINQQQELAEKNRKLEEIAYYDPMTGLYSRGRFEVLLESEISSIHKFGHESSIIILDIDCFKEINDNYGHPVGDMVIKQIASILQKKMRETDAAARWGGDEFQILLPNTSLSDARIIAETLRKEIEGAAIFIKEDKIHITASFGVTWLKHGVNGPLELTYKDVDKALYLAKNRGRNCVEIA